VVLPAGQNHIPYHEWLNQETTDFGTKTICEYLLYILNGYSNSNVAPKNIITVDALFDGDYIGIGDVGDRVDIDMTDFDTGNVVLDIYGTKGIITSVEQDIIKVESKAKVWVYGT
jgi:hypothetical protein